VIKLKGKKDLFKSLFLACIASGIIFILIVQIIYRLHNPSDSSAVRKYDGWYTMLNYEKSMIENNVKIQTKNEEYSIYNILPKQLNNDAILFRTYHQEVVVIVEGRVIYEYGKDKKVSFSKYPGSSYHIVDLDNSFAGKPIEIKFKSLYELGGGKIFDFYIGQPKSLALLVVSENLPSLVISLLLFIIGIFFVVSAIIFAKKIKTRQTLYVGIFTILFAQWSILQSCILQFVLNENVTLMFMEYVAFLLIPISMVMYVRELFRLYDDKGLKILAGSYCVSFIGCIILQLTGIRDIKEMLPVVHIMIFSGIIYIFHIIHKMYRKCNNLFTRRTIRIMCLLIFCLILIDMFRYYYLTEKDESKFTRLGILIFISYMLFSYAQKYINKSKEFTEAKLMAKLAYKDVMTGLYNRTAYAEDIADYEKQLYLAPTELNLIYVIFDLNDLKAMNDFHGHGVGDHYIVTTGKIIKKAFEKIGKCYRIGGDEFAVIMKDQSLAEYSRAIKELKNLISHENEAADLEYSLAFGYAVFEAGKYTSLTELIDKADKNMYENKNIYKEHKIFLTDLI
jgi:diguanylate cyclase (GGDEF)-like protein